MCWNRSGLLARLGGGVMDDGPAARPAANEGTRPLAARTGAGQGGGLLPPFVPSVELPLGTGRCKVPSVHADQAGGWGGDTGGLARKTQDTQRALKLRCWQGSVSRALPDTHSLCVRSSNGTGGPVFCFANSGPPRPGPRRQPIAPDARSSSRPRATCPGRWELRSDRSQGVLGIWSPGVREPRAGTVRSRGSGRGKEPPGPVEAVGSRRRGPMAFLKFAAFRQLVLGKGLPMRSQERHGLCPEGGPGGRCGISHPNYPGLTLSRWPCRPRTSSRPRNQLLSPDHPSPAMCPASNGTEATLLLFALCPRWLHLGGTALYKCARLGSQATPCHLSGSEAVQAGWTPKSRRTGMAFRAPPRCVRPASSPASPHCAPPCCGHPG